MSTSWPLSPQQGQPSRQTVRFSIAPVSPRSSVGVVSIAPVSPRSSMGVVSIAPVSPRSSVGVASWLGSDIPLVGQSAASPSQAQPRRGGFQQPVVASPAPPSTPAGVASSTSSPSVLGQAVLQRPGAASSLPLSAPSGVTSAASSAAVPAQAAGQPAPCDLTPAGLSRRRSISTVSSQSSQTDASLQRPFRFSSRRAFIQTEGEDDVAEMDQLFFNMTEEEFVECMGLGALSILARDAKDAFGLVRIAAQAFTLQFAVLYGMWLCIHREDNCKYDVAGRLPLSLICVAIYLHFMNVFVDIPFALCLMLNFRHLKPSLKEACMAMPIFLADALLVPAATMVVGALFLCTSMTIQDVFLNSVACTFVSGVDNWILNLSMKLNRMAGEKRSGTVHIPYQKNVITVLDYAVCVLPVVPLLFTGAMAYLGLEYMGMPCPGGWELD